MLHVKTNEEKCLGNFKSEPTEEGHRKKCSGTLLTSERGKYFALFIRDHGGSGHS